MKRTAIIVDVDGTLADVTSIRHHVLNRPKNFEAFHSEAVHVPPHMHVVDMVNKAKNDGHDILVVTARRARWRDSTAFWLALNGIPSDALYMRADKDGRPDYEVKKEILEKISQTWTVVHAIDDNPNVIRLWEENGISTTTIEGWVYDE